MLMQNIAHSVVANHPEVYLIVLLIDERPEEVTDMARTVGARSSSTFDEPASRHVQVAEMVIEKAKRLVEHGRDVVILLDRSTARARLQHRRAILGKALTGGVDANALQRPEAFGAARNIEDGGSLLIIATALIDTGSRMDEVIFEEFKGTGNSEIQLDRRLADKRVYPAIDINKSGTRKEELLVDRGTLSRMGAAPTLSPMGTMDAIEFLTDKMRVTNPNAEFWDSMNPDGARQERLPNNLRKIRLPALLEAAEPVVKRAQDLPGDRVASTVGSLGPSAARLSWPRASATMASATQSPTVILRVAAALNAMSRPAAAHPGPSSGRSPHRRSWADRGHGTGGSATARGGGRRLSGRSRSARPAEIGVHGSKPAPS